MCRSTSSSSSTVEQPQINVAEVDGAQQSTIEVFSPSLPVKHLRSNSDTSSSLPVPESSMEATNTSSLQHMNQDTTCDDVSTYVYMCMCMSVCVHACLYVCVHAHQGLN